MSPVQKWILSEPGRLKFSQREQQCVHRVTCSSKLGKRKIFGCFLKEVPEKFQAPQILAPTLLGDGGGLDNSGREGARARKPENDFHV